jgi:hypothetical protein
MLRPAVAAVAAGALSFSLPAAALAAYAPSFEVSFGTYSAAGAPSVSSVMRQEIGEDPTRTIAAVFPPAFTYNPGFSVTGCRAEEERAAACPEASRLGEAVVLSPLGMASGPIHLTEDFRLFVPLRALGGLYEYRVVGKIRALADGSPELVFDELPPLPVTESRLRVDGGPKAIFLNPRNCGRYEIRGRFVSHEDAEVTRSAPIDITGCAQIPIVSSIRVSPGRVRAGRVATVTWRLSTAARWTRVEIHRAGSGAWRHVGTLRGPAAAGRNSLRIRRAGGRRLRPGRYRVLVRAVAEGDAVSRSRGAGFRVLG